MNTIAGKGPYRLASRDFAADRTTGVQIGSRTFGGKAFLVAAGPCSVENEEMMRATGHAVGIQGAALLRGGAFKPRTSPYSFDGLKDEGLRILARVRDETGLPVVTEVLDLRHAELVAGHADMLQIGARNMQNFSLLREVTALSDGDQSLDFEGFSTLMRGLRLFAEAAGRTV